MRNDRNPLIIVGGGLAASTLAIELRELGDDRDIVILGAEEHPPYERPPLTKAYLRGEVEVESTYVRPREWYASAGIDLWTGSRVLEIDPARYAVTTRRYQLSYSTLVLATGARSNVLPPNIGAKIPVHLIRDLADSDRLRAALQPGARLVIVGGGWLGLEVAASARMIGAEVTLVVHTNDVLGPILGAELGRHLLEIHRERGVDVRLGTSVLGIDGDVVRLSDDTSVVADLVLQGVGAVANDVIAAAAGLETQRGVLVDASLRTSHPDIFAIGDLAKHAHPLIGTRIQEEHWDNAVGQGKHVARTLVEGPSDYEGMPYYFSDQYDNGMEFFGHVGHVGHAGYDRVSVDRGANSVQVRWFDERGLIAAAHVDDWDAGPQMRAEVADAWARHAGVPAP